jgi:16S rRNA processing protein RimM
VFPLTQDPAQVFAPGRELHRLNLMGEVIGPPVVIERSRQFHREWLLKFKGVEHRAELDSWRGLFLAAPAASLRSPAEGEVYLHELEGFAVRDEAGNALGIVTALYELPSGLMIEVQGPKREFLLPFRKEFVLAVDRAERRLVVSVPEGLLE